VGLITDSYDTRRYMKSIFAPFCRVVEARDGQEALDMCKKSVPDLIITDVMMPIVRLLCLPKTIAYIQLDGFGLLNALKQDKQLAMLPIIML
jgi:CheY-like chemotaxis protein